MTDQALRTNPSALPGAESPSSGWHEVNGCRLYVEVRGRGPGLLLVGASSDDAEMFRPIAERLTDFTVVTYDRRGTLRSSRDGWPCDAAQHADDAAGLLTLLGLSGADVFGASAGGIVAVQLALRHPAIVRRVLAFEPGYLAHAASGRALLAQAVECVDEHLRRRPDDWRGAMAAASVAATTGARKGEPPHGLLDPPVGLEWYATRSDSLAENFIRDDIPTSGEAVDLSALAASSVDLRFSYGTDSHPAFREIVEELTRATALNSTEGAVGPDRLEGVGHVAYYTPGIIAAYIRRQCV